MARLINDLKGKRFGRLIAIYNSDKRNRAGDVIWICLCMCGRLVGVGRYNLKSGKTKSCGCLKKEIASGVNYKHGEARKNLQTRLHRIWSGIIGRCNYSSHTSYKYYGEKGIKVCDDWKSDFMIFKNWALNSGYKENLTIDRIDGDGNYKPDNCQWITKEENSRKGCKERKSMRMINKITMRKG